MGSGLPGFGCGITMEPQPWETLGTVVDRSDMTRCKLQDRSKPLNRSHLWETEEVEVATA